MLTTPLSSAPLTSANLLWDCNSAYAKQGYLLLACVVTAVAAAIILVLGYFDFFGPFGSGSFYFSEAMGWSVFVLSVSIPTWVNAFYNSDAREEPRLVRLLTGREIYVKPTAGDGSCAFHALLGSPNEYGVYKTNAKQKREEFCSWLRAKYQQKDLPKNIENVLHDYFMNLSKAPPSFQREIGAVHKKYRGEEYASLPLAAKDERARQFIYDPDVFEAYIRNMKDTSYFLLQDELIAAAICFNKVVVLHQPGWGNCDKMGRVVVTESGDEEVHIYYNGYNHYERAESAQPVNSSAKK